MTREAWECPRPSAGHSRWDKSGVDTASHSQLPSPGWSRKAWGRGRAGLSTLGIAPVKVSSEAAFPLFSHLGDGILGGSIPSLPSQVACDLLCRRLWLQLPACTPSSSQAPPQGRPALPVHPN